MEQVIAIQIQKLKFAKTDILPRSPSLPVRCELILVSESLRLQSFLGTGLCGVGPIIIQCRALFLTLGTVQPAGLRRSELRMKPKKEFGRWLLQR